MAIWERVQSHNLNMNLNTTQQGGETGLHKPSVQMLCSASCIYTTGILSAGGNSWRDFSPFCCVWQVFTPMKSWQELSHMRVQKSTGVKTTTDTLNMWWSTSTPWVLLHLCRFLIQETSRRRDGFCFLMKNKCQISDTNARFDWVIHRLFCWLTDIFSADEQLFFLHHISRHALPSAPLRQREEPGDSLGLDPDDVCRWVPCFSLYS